MSVIELTAVKKSFSCCSVLKGISLSIEAGEMVALIGPSGSGKSTLMRHLSGLTLADKNSQSEITVLGNRIQKSGRLDRNIRSSRAEIGNIFQQFNLVNRLSVLTNVLIGGLSRVPVYRSLLGWYTAEEKREALRALDRVGLKEYALKRASDLSGGQQQRVAIARALMQKAKIILADEPIASLDPESSRSVMEALKTINERDGITVVVTLHQVDYAQEFCQRALALKEGEVFFDGRFSEMTQRQLDHLYRLNQSESEAAADANVGTQPIISAVTPTQFSLKTA